ncbi:MAG: Nif3-like dinuclear metal center hexameric protein [Clostridia bacterium]|nr:Nif3-like dinuclear metal center hexameric protein [Clostridia bacterium]
MVSVKDFFEYLNTIAPLDTQEDWDNSGMLVGDMNAEVRRAVVVLDIDLWAVKKAKELGANLIISHHPVIFNAMKSFTKGSVPFELASNSISAICMHTPLDIADGGTNDALADLLGFTAYKGENPILRFADIEETTADKLASHIAARLCSRVRFADAGKPVSKIAICTGGGASLMYEAGKIDAFITGDAKHNDFLDAVGAGITLIAAGHYETEIPVVPVVTKKLQDQFRDIEIIDIGQKNPVQFTE